MVVERAGASVITRLMSRKECPPLIPDHVWHPSLDKEIAALSEHQLADGRPDGIQSAQAWKAALHLWNDSLDAAHELVQELETPTGSVLHGIMHRRESDFDNAKYWFHRAGDHPAYHSLQSRASRFLTEQIQPLGILSDVRGQIMQQGSWNPYLFTNAVAIIVNRIGDDAARTVLEQLQQLELEAMIRYLEGTIFRNETI